MSRRKRLPIVVFGLLSGSLFILISAMGMAQTGNPFAPAPAAAMDQLNQANPSGGLNSSTYINRAREAAAPAGGKDNPFGMPMPAGPAGPVGPAGYPGANPYAFGPAVNAPGYVAQPTPTPAPMARVLTGERVYSHLEFGTSPPELLQDAEIIQLPLVPNELKKQYFDDGTHGDVKANDNIWSYVTQRNDVMSPEEFVILNRILAALSTNEDTDPSAFFRLPVATDEALSLLPKVMDLQGRRDEKITEWNTRVLAVFRKNKDDTTSEFWPVFIPPPPTAPRIEIPFGFNPAPKPTGTPQGMGGMGMASGRYGPMGGAAGGPAGGAAEGGNPYAQSSYFATGGK